MKRSAPEQNPHGRGNTQGSRAPRARLAAGLGRLSTSWEPFGFGRQRSIAAVDRGITLAAGGLGSGKSEPGAFLLLKWALRHPRREDGRPTRWFVVGPKFELIRQEQFGKILEHCRRLKELGYGSIVKRVVTGIEPRIILMHDQVLLGRSGTDPERFRGHEVDGFWFDEAQNQTEEAFRVAFSRLRSTSATRVVITSSPEDTPAWVWHMLSGKHKGYNEVRARLEAEGEGCGMRAFRWSSGDNRTNTAGVLGTVRAVLNASSDVASQELEGRFPGSDELAQTSAFDLAGSFTERAELTPGDMRPESLGVDVGETRDFTWLTVMSATGFVLWMDRFNVSTPGVPTAQFYPYLEKRIQAAAKEWRVRKVVIDIAKLGRGVADHAELLLPGFEVVPYDTGVVGKKSELVETLGLALSRGDVRVAKAWTGPDRHAHTVEWVPYLQKELSSLVPIDMGQGRRKWDHPKGGHDDGVISVGLAWHGVDKRGRGGGGAPLSRRRRDRPVYPGLDIERPS